jgi:aryl-alcohol dehydrogenase-like predicted oxidoreductase
MKYRNLGQGLTVSAIGVGCMTMTEGNIVYGGNATTSESTATVHRAIDLGVTFFDTAQIYGPFANEEFLGGWSSPPNSGSNSTTRPSSASTGHPPMRARRLKVR